MELRGIYVHVDVVQKSEHLYTQQNGPFQSSGMALLYNYQLGTGNYQTNYITGLKKVKLFGPENGHRQK
jgi:hypothetical protein